MKLETPDPEVSFDRTVIRLFAEPATYLDCMGVIDHPQQGGK
jgi:hypothetical protein